MDVRSICVLTALLAVCAVGCSKETERGSEVVPITAPAEAPVVMPTENQAPLGANSRPAPTTEKLTPEELRELMDPTPVRPPPPTDHRLRLGIDGDPGYAQDELTPEELAAARAAGAAVPQPTYAPQPSEPSRAEQPSEASEDASEEESDNVYVGGTRAPVYRHHVREEVREDNPREPSAEPQPHEPPHTNPPRRGPHR